MKGALIAAGIAAVADPAPERLIAFAARLELTRRAAASGNHVQCRKPMAPSPEDCRCRPAESDGQDYLKTVASVEAGYRSPASRREESVQ